jgi:branched-chain amino acid transport system permease protein
LNTRCGVPILLTLPISALISALFAIIISKPILHLRGDYLCLVTIGFGEIVRLFLFNDPLGITGGINGIRNIDRPSILGFVFKRPIHYYYLTLTFVALIVFIMKRLENSRLGRAWVYVREDELAAEAMGIDTTYVKLLAFTIGAALAGVAGTLYACRYTVIAPETFSFWNSCIMFCIVVLGGTGSIPGVFVGTVGMVVLPELLRDALGKILQWRMLVFGAAMVLMMIFRPEGLWPSPVRRHELHAIESRSSELKR